MISASRTCTSFYHLPNALSTQQKSYLCNFMKLAFREVTFTKNAGIINGSFYLPLMILDEILGSHFQVIFVKIYMFSHLFRS